MKALALIATLAVANGAVAETGKDFFTPPTKFKCVDPTSETGLWCKSNAERDVSSTNFDEDVDMEKLDKACYENHLENYDECNADVGCAWHPDMVMLCGETEDQECTSNADCHANGGMWTPFTWKDGGLMTDSQEMFIALNNRINGIVNTTPSPTCATKPRPKPEYSANITLIGIGAGVFVFTLLAAFIISKMGWFDVPKDDGTAMREPDEMAVDLADGPICRFCPNCYTLSVSVITLGLMGFIVGALTNMAFTDCAYNAEQEGADEADKLWCTNSRRDWLKLIGLPGALWVNGLKLFVGPLMVFMFLLMPFRVSNYARKGWRTIFLLTATSFFAAMEGLFWVNVIRPGDNMGLMTKAQQEAAGIGCDGVTVEQKDTSALYGAVSPFNSITGIFEKAVVKDILTGFSGLNIFAIILFFCCMGICLKKQNTNASERQWRDATVSCSKGIMKALLSMVIIVIYITPLAMLSLVSYQIARMDNTKYTAVLTGVGLYVLTQFLGQFCHMFIFYPVFSWCMTCHRTQKENGPPVGCCCGFLSGWQYFLKVFQAPLTAFATSSSAATLPVTLAMVKNKDRGNIPKESADLCVPLGAAINMDGTGLGFPVMIVFTAQAYGVELNGADQFVVAMLAVVCSIGTAPIPNAGLIYITMLFSATGNEFLSQEEVIGTGLTLILLMDWLVDRLETAQNVWSDCNIARIVSIWEEDKPAVCLRCVPGCRDNEGKDMFGEQNATSPGNDVDIEPNTPTGMAEPIDMEMQGNDNFTVASERLPKDKDGFEPKQLSN